MQRAQQNSKPKELERKDPNKKLESMPHTTNLLKNRNNHLLMNFQKLVVAQNQIILLLLKHLQ